MAGGVMVVVSVKFVGGDLHLSLSTLGDSTPEGAQPSDQLTPMSHTSPPCSLPT